MTPLDLQQTLIEELTTLLKDVLLPTVAGGEAAPTGYEQALPVVTEDEDDDSKFFPYFIVRIETGKITGFQGWTADESPWTVNLTVLLGTYDPDKNTNGHRALLEMITRITNRFIVHPCMGKNDEFRAIQEGMNWALQDEDTYPFYFGAIEIPFYVPKIERSDPYA